VVASSLNLFRNGAVGFIDWLDLFGISSRDAPERRFQAATSRLPEAWTYNLKEQDRRECELHRG
jgi:hypothetical protein